MWLVYCIFLKENGTESETGGEPVSGKATGDGEAEQDKTDQSETSTDEKQVRWCFTDFPMFLNFPWTINNL